MIIYRKAEKPETVIRGIPKNERREPMDEKKGMTNLPAYMTTVDPANQDLYSAELASRGEIPWLLPIRVTETGDIYAEFSGEKCYDWSKICSSKESLLSFMLELVSIAEEARRYLLNPSLFLGRWEYLYELAGKPRFLLVPVVSEDVTEKDLKKGFCELLAASAGYHNGKEWYDGLVRFMTGEHTATLLQLKQMLYELRFG